MLPLRRERWRPLLKPSRQRSKDDREVEPGATFSSLGVVTIPPPNDTIDFIDRRCHFRCGHGCRAD